MKKVAMLFILVFCLSSCSFFTAVSRVFLPSNSSKPQHTQESSREYLYKNSQEGIVIHDRIKNYDQKERKSTFFETLGSAIAKLSIGGALLIAAAGLLIPGFGGWLIGNTFNNSRIALEATVTALGRAKRAGSDVWTELRAEHQKNKTVKDTIYKMRAKTSA